MTPESATELAHYRLDPASSTLTAQAFAEGLFSAFGHDPVISIKGFSGDAEFVPGTFASARLLLTIKPESLSVANDVKEKDRMEIERMTREEVLETGSYPEITFQSSNISLSRLAEGRYRARVIGDLTLHGVTQKNLWITAEVTVDTDSLKAKGQLSIKQSDYKIKLVSVAGGTLKIKNEVKCSFDVVARSVK